MWVGLRRLQGSGATRSDSGMTRVKPSAAAPAAAGRRLFTALFPDAALRAALDAARQPWRGATRPLRPRPERLHLTLQFCAHASAAQEVAWRQALARLRFAPFTLTLERVECWRLPRERVWVLRPAPSVELTALHQRSAALAHVAGLMLPERTWKPHLTLLRHAPAGSAPEALALLHWTVREVVLVCSDLRAQPARYDVLGRFGAP